jgi:hypothetical protein
VLLYLLLLGLKSTKLIRHYFGNLEIHMERMKPLACERRAGVEVEGQMVDWMGIEMRF